MNFFRPKPVTRSFSSVVILPFLLAQPHVVVMSNVILEQDGSVTFAELLRALLEFTPLPLESNTNAMVVKVSTGTY